MLDPFWNNHYKAFRVQEPSNFAQYVTQHYLRSTDTLIELGCGNGRDARLLIQKVKRYIGIDGCPVAIEACGNNIAQKANVTLQCTDFTNIDFDAFTENTSRFVMYSRFSLHSVNYTEADRLLSNLNKVTTVPWLFLLEARTIYDELYGVGEQIGLHEFRTDHYRRFLDPAVFLQRLSTSFAVKYFEVAQGFARFGDQDPLVLRTVFAKQDSSLDAL